MRTTRRPPGILDVVLGREAGERDSERAQARRCRARSAWSRASRRAAATPTERGSRRSQGVRRRERRRSSPVARGVSTAVDRGDDGVRERLLRRFRGQRSPRRHRGASATHASATSGSSQVSAQSSAGHVARDLGSGLRGRDGGRDGARQRRPSKSTGPEIVGVDAAARQQRLGDAAAPSGSDSSTHHHRPSRPCRSAPARGTSRCTRPPVPQ